MREDFQFIGIDITSKYVDIARSRIEYERASVAADRAIQHAQLDLFQEVAP